VPSLDPTDVYPPSNLPGRAVPWGRTIEGDMGLLKKARMSLSQSLKALNRLLAASLQTLGDQITTLSDQQATLSSAVSDIDSQQTTLNSTVATLGTTVDDLDATQVTLADTVSDLNDTQVTLADTVSDLDATQTRITETNVISSNTQGVYNAPGFITQWSDTKPSWANYAMITLTGATKNSGSPTGEVVVSVYHDSSPISSTAGLSNNISTAFYIDSSGTAIQASYGCVIPVSGSTLYTRPYRTETIAGTGSSSITFLVNIIWVA